MNTIRDIIESIGFELGYYWREFRFNFYRKPVNALHRARYGWAPMDVWNMDAYITDVIPPMLRHLAHNSVGCPNKYFDKDNTEDQGHIWTKMLLEAADDLEAVKVIEEKFNNGDYKLTTTRYSEFFKMDVPDTDYKTYEEERKAAVERRKKGWTFIMDNMDGLWD